jgi:predicted dehydrogenase
MLHYVRDVLLRKELGPVLYYQQQNQGGVVDGSFWHATTWRTVPNYQGGGCPAAVAAASHNAGLADTTGFVLDGGVHQAAQLRVCLPHPPASITSNASLHRTHLLPHDTVIGLALPPKAAITEPHGPKTKLNPEYSEEDVPVPSGQSGPTGTILLSWALPNIPAEAKRPGSTEVVCLNGRVEWFFANGTFTVKVTGAEGSGVKDEVKEGPSIGVKVEIDMFANAIEGKKEVNYAEPRAALWDLAVIQALLTSNGKEIILADLIAGK